VAVDSSDDRSYTEAVSINVTVAASQVTSDTLQQLLDETVASYVPPSSLARVACMEPHAAPGMHRVRAPPAGPTRRATLPASSPSCKTSSAYATSRARPAHAPRRLLTQLVLFPCALRLQVLRDPEAVSNLSPEEQEALRKQLSDAVAYTANHTETTDSDTGAALVNALNAVVLASSAMDEALFNQVLQLVRTLASHAGDSAAALLDIVAAMLSTRGVASEDEADAINESLEQLTLALLDAAVCGEAGRSVDGDGIQLNAAFKSSYTGESYELLGGAGAAFGDMSEFEATSTDVVDDSICTKSQLLVQTTPPYVVAFNATENQYAAPKDQRSGADDAKLISARARAPQQRSQTRRQCDVLYGVSLQLHGRRRRGAEPHRRAVL